MDEQSAAVYEEFFVPALFARWPERVLGAAQVHSGDHVLDVACGTTDGRIVEFPIAAHIAAVVKP